MKLTLPLVASLLVIVSLLLISPATIVGQEQGPAAVGERLAADTLETTVLGNPFVAPKDWSIRVKGPATILEAPEGGSWIALVDLQAKSADEALKAALAVVATMMRGPVPICISNASLSAAISGSGRTFSTAANSASGRKSASGCQLSKLS